MPPRKRTRRSGGAPQATQIPETQGIRTSSRSVTPSQVQNALSTPGRGQSYRTRRRRVFRGPEVAVREGGRGDLVPPSDDEEYDEWRAVRAVERAEGGGEGEGEGEEGGYEEGGEEDGYEGMSTNAIAGPSRYPSSSPSSATTATLPLYLPLFDDYPSSSSDVELSSSPITPSRKGKERATAESPRYLSSPPARIALSSPKPFLQTRRKVAAVHDSSSIHRPPPDPIPPDGPDPPDDETGPWGDGKADETAEETIAVPNTAAGRIGQLGGSWASLDMDLAVPPEMVQDYPRELSASMSTQNQDEQESGLVQPGDQLRLEGREGVSREGTDEGPPIEVALQPDFANEAAFTIDEKVDGDGSQLDSRSNSRAADPGQTTPRARLAAAKSRSAAPGPLAIDKDSEPMNTFGSPTPDSANDVTLGMMDALDGLASSPIKVKGRFDAASQSHASNPTTSPSPTPFPPSHDQRRKSSTPLPAGDLDIVVSDLDMARGQLGRSASSHHSLPPPSSSPDALDILAQNGRLFNDVSVAAAAADANGQQSRQLAASQAFSARSNARSEAVITDPALLQFRSARTFRTRTALQLQPYTKEKQLYESVLRRGGLSKGRRGVAPPSQIRAAADDKDVDDPASLGEESTSDEDHVAPEAIVIGGTQSHPECPPRPPQELVDADFDEYFAKFGEVAVEEDELAQKRLQAIARIRVRAEKRLIREERAAERTRRNFEALMKEGEKEQRSKDREERQRQKESERKEREDRERLKAAHAARIAAHRKAKADREEAIDTSRKMGTAKSVARSSKRPLDSTKDKSRPKTYGRKRDVTARPPQAVDDGSDSPLSSVPASPVVTPTAIPSSPGRAFSKSSSPARFPLSSPGFQEYDHGNDPGFDNLHDYYQGVDPPLHANFDHDRDDRTTPAPISTSSRTPMSTKRRRVIESSSQSSGGSSDDDTPHVSAADRRRRIAERMLPRAMLKRLESEAQKKQRAREDRRRATAAASESPVRRGHAVVRRAAEPRLDDMTDLFDDGSDDDIQEIHIVEAEEGSDGSDSDDMPIVVSDDSGSEAMEDNRHHDGLARLQDGDFEAIVHGRNPRANTSDPSRSRDRKERREERRKRERRPALGLVKTVRAARPARPARPDSPRRMLQARIDFPVFDGPPPKEQKRQSKKTKQRARLNIDVRPQAARNQGRPAIRLKDAFIFADHEFDFPQEDTPAEDSRHPRSENAKRSLVKVTLRNDGRLGRTTASPSPAPPPVPTTHVQVDEGVGKARSWANFDKFPIDFDITPLPSGVFCAPTTVINIADSFLAISHCESIDEPKPLTAFGVTVHQSMPIDEVLAVLPIIMEESFNAITSEATSSSKTHIASLTFLRDYIARSDDYDRALLLPPLRTFSDRLHGLALSGAKHERVIIEQVLHARVVLLQMAIIVGEDAVAAGADVVDLLLTYGFDRTVRSLRRILRGQSDTPEINDASVAVWVALLHILGGRQDTNTGDDLFIDAVTQVLDKRYSAEVGPLAAERIWYLIFGLCALSQFGPDGKVSAEFSPHPRWALVKRALGLIKVTHSLEAEESARHDQLQGRDRYIKTMVARCLRLSATWQWSFDNSSFSVATRDLGMIFKERQHRNLPTEQPVDFPAFISQFDISLTASDDTHGASAFELWLRLASVAASDLIASAEELAEAQKAERDVQRLIMSIFPLSAVPFTREKPPTARQLAALVNRYSTMVVACYFSPSLLPWLLANSQKWLSFERADFNSRQTCIRGLMYLAVACRHHNHDLTPVVNRLADILAILQSELESLTRPYQSQLIPTRVEIERTMVLVVSCFRQIILHAGYTPRPDSVYPDPALLHEAWTGRVFQLNLAKDIKSGLEIVSTIQAFLDARSAALPKRARQARETRQKESVDDYPSLGFDFEAIDLAALGGDEAPQDPTEAQDAEFAKIILDVICPRIYRLLSDMLPPVEEHQEPAERAERLVFINKLTKCWSDCAGIVVVEHQLMEWSAYVGPFGQQSWSRLPNDLGRIRVGLQFMLNVTHLDPGAFAKYEEEFIALLFQTIVTDRLTVEHKYASALFALPGASEHALFEGISSLEIDNMDRSAFMEKRDAILDVIFSNIPLLLRSRFTPAAMKPLIYRCVNLLVSSLALYEGAIDGRSVLHKETYRVFCADTVRRLKNLAGEFVTPDAVPALRLITWA